MHQGREIHAPAQRSVLIGAVAFGVGRVRSPAASGREIVALATFDLRIEHAQ